MVGEINSCSKKVDLRELFKLTKSAMILGLIIISSCKSNIDSTLIKVENKLDSKIYIELWGFPAKGYQGNKAGAFSGITEPDSSFIIEFVNNNIYIKTYEISPVYNTSDYDGFEIFIYKPIGDELVMFGVTPKDTLYFERVDLKDLLDNRPKNIKIE
jgi:hypothetical protein